MTEPAHLLSDARFPLSETKFSRNYFEISMFSVCVKTRVPSMISKFLMKEPAHLLSDARFPLSETKFSIKFCEIMLFLLSKAYTPL